MKPHASVIAAVLRCWCRTDPVEAREATRLDERGWELLAETALREGVAGLVHRSLSRDPAGALAPPRARSVLKRAALEQAATHAWEQATLVELLEAFAARGLQPVLLRGHGLIADLFDGDGSLRPQVDHDFLFSGEAIEAARDTLREQGFENRPEGSTVFVRDGFTVDLHQDPYDRERVPSRGKVIRADTGSVLRRAVPGNVAGRPAFRLSPADRLTVLSVHLVKHSFDRLIRLVDLAELWRRFPVDPWELQRRARDDGTADALFYALSAARVRLDAAVPEDFLTRIRPPSRRYVDRAFARTLRGLACPFFAEWLLLYQLDGPRARLTALREMLWPADEAARIRSKSPYLRSAAFSARMVRMVSGAAGSALSCTRR